MNRHDRRKAASQERKGQDTMGTSYTLSDVPESIRQHPKYQEGQRRAENGEGFPPEYYQAIGVAAKLVAEWVRSQGELDLKWLASDADRTFIAAGLDLGARYLADSPDAFRLLAWLDETTGRQLSLNMATWALRQARVIPMPDGSYWNGEPS